MEDILQSFANITNDAYRSLANWKRDHNKKIVGCLPMYVPEEMIHAAGMLPVVLQESSVPISQGNSYIQTFFCGFVRGIIDTAVNDRLDLLDGIVAADTCDPIRKTIPVLERKLHLEYCETIYLPPTVKRATSKLYALDELARLRSSLEKLGNCEITDESLRKSIIVYNRNRDLLRKLYDIRRNKPGLLATKDVLAIVVASMLMPKEEHSILLEKLLAKLGDIKPLADTGPRLIISGSLCTAAQTDILDLIDETGATIVDDDLYTGSRYFMTDAIVDENPLESLVNRYLMMARSCPTVMNLEDDWGGFLLQIANRAQAQGVITLLVKYCEPLSIYHTHLQQKLSIIGIPELPLEVEHGPVPNAQIRNRVEAFVEMITR